MLKPGFDALIHDWKTCSSATNPTGPFEDKGSGLEPYGHVLLQMEAMILDIVNLDIIWKRNQSGYMLDWLNMI